ncbi:hypothetical protein ACFFLE_07760, partial [Salinicoccus siamensis]
MTPDVYDIISETYDKAYTSILNVQSKLIEIQSECSIKLSEGYAEQLEEVESEVEANEGVTVGKLAKGLRDATWNGVKKGISAAWNNRDKAKQFIYEEGQKSQDKIILQKECNRQVELNTLSQIRFNSSSKLRL